ncbi:MAG: reverse gyrase [Desulfurococcales archaeon]|nr:reverse gyrase [Desulfurococcales archaeon]
MSKVRHSRAVYRWACPNCGGSNNEERLSKGLPCPLCLPEEPSVTTAETILEVARALRRHGRLKGYAELEKLERESRELIRFFEKAVRSSPWGAQRAWARRVVRGDSFSIVAPTGVGKTTFGIVAALYFACKRGEKSYIILPTTALVIHAEQKASLFMENLGCTPRLVAIHSRMGRKRRAELIQAIQEGDFDVLITTAAFARVKSDLVSSHRYRMVFVDDVDAVLKSAKSINTILRIIGFKDEEIDLGMEILRLQRRRAILLTRIASIRETGRGMEQLERLREELDKLEKKLESLKAKVERARRERVASLIVSTATGRPRGSRVRLFASLLNFEAGGRAAWSLRRVYDLYTYPSDGVYRRVVEIASHPLFRDGGLVYVPIDHGIEGAERLADMLREAGLRAQAYHSKTPPRVLEEYERGEIEILVGVANYYGTLVRGLDMPERVRYALFAGIPRHKFPADIGEPHPARLIRLLALLVEIPIREVAEEARHHMVRLRDLLRRLSPAALHVIAERVLSGDVEAPGSPTRIVAEAYNFLRRAMEDPEVWEHLRERRDVAVIEEEGKRYLLIPDVPTYIQASGRTSRLYAGGLTLGISVVVVDNDNLLYGLTRKMRLYVETEWRRLEEVDIEEIMREVDEDRRKVRSVRRGEVRVKDLVKTALLIVESPNKARTIANFFGQPSIRFLPGGSRVYEVTTGNLLLSILASGGHVYDLAAFTREEDLRVAGLDEGEVVDLFSVAISGGDGSKRFTPVYTSIKRCLDCGYQFTAELDRCPVCGSRRIRNSASTVEDIRRVAWEVDTVLIGTDPDMEGEKIGWDVAALIRPFSRKLMRVEFHEITKKAILEALENPREFDQKLVDAQVVRRVEDRWIGYTLSPLLWCHFWPRYYCPDLALRGLPRSRFLRNEIERCKGKYFYNLSAGRVQTPVLGWIVERTNESKQKIYLVTLTVEVDGGAVRFTVREDEFNVEAGTGPKPAVSAILRELAREAGKGRSEVDVEVEVVKREWDTLPPLPPYTTDTMLADASRYLGLGAPETMRLAQNLFEWGLITYHRTDSTRVSEKGIQIAREYLRERYGDLGDKLFRGRSWGAGGAHEAIRPTRPIDAETLWNMIQEGILELPGVFTRNHLRLYDLIFKRFIASQMREAVVERTTYKIKFVDLVFQVEGITMIGREGDEESKGFTIVWPYIPQIPRIYPGVYPARVALSKISSKPLYTQGDVVRLMKERGIGRPSTYAKIIDTLLKRKYVTRLVNRGRQRDLLVATHRGMKVHEYLTVAVKGEDIVADFLELGPKAVETIKRIPQLVSEQRTRDLEQQMDMIERGETNREFILESIYNEIEGIAIPISRMILEVSQNDPGRVRGPRWMAECLSRSIAAAIARLEQLRAGGRK